MATFPQSGQTAEFDNFELDLSAGELRKDGLKVKLQEQPFSILAALVKRAGDLVHREDLYSHLFSKHSSYDYKHALNNAIQKIRQALDDPSINPRFIETVEGRGYRFLKQVKFNQKNKFMQEVSQIHAEFLATDHHPRLHELFHRVNDLMEEYPTHPDRYKAKVLSDSIRAACNETNKLKHGIGLETAALVFNDPKALSLRNHFNGQQNVWHTLGSVPNPFPMSADKVMIVVLHSVEPDENGNLQIQISSARKATTREIKSYEDKNRNNE